MNYFSSIQKLQERMKVLLKEHDIEEYSFSLRRFKNLADKGTHNFDENKIEINIDNLFYNLTPTQSEQGFYSILPRISVPVKILDKILISQCHEVIHAMEFSDPIRNIGSKDLERTALEDICCIFDGFRKGNYINLSFEARAFSKSITMARDFLVKHENISQQQANERILEAVNFKASERDFLKPVGYKPEKSELFEFLNLDIYKKPKFETFDDIIESCNEIIKNSENHTFNRVVFSEPESSFFSFPFYTIESKADIERLNEKIKNLGYTKEFYASLNVKDRLYLQAAVIIEFYDEYKEINPDIKDLYGRLQKWSDANAINHYKLELEYFNDKLEIFRKSKEKERSSREDIKNGLFG